MPTIKIYKQDGSSAGTMELDDSVFGVEYNEPLIHQVVVAQRANARQGTKSTLTRTEVRGGGKKPWRQKGTGNARQGSIRAPQWKGGGVVFAPKPRSFRQKVNKLVRINAITSALSAKLSDGNLIVVDKLDLEPKTKQMAAILKALKIESRVLLVLPEGSDNALRAAHNIPTVRTSACESVNVYDVVANSVILTTVDAIKAIEQKYTAKEVVAQ
ncbi:MAG: 50S ribosomal protein L4 [Clostridia bacterium]|jgi:large subunit ribosomal protein L4|nr:50S ribosomal protein L4 [Clostridia bacterium]MCI9459541.1 50S ribosomal protein L4 [Clostridia bacterium]